MKLIRALIILFAFAALGVAQSTPKAPAGTTAPDYSGMYSFLQDGEFVQITVEDQGRVTGFVSRFGELPSDRGAFLDQFFKKGSLEGQKLTFLTEPVHGVWYEFRGTLGRGEGKTPNDEGYYVAKGTLMQHTTDANKKTSTRSREVVLKSFPQDYGLAPSKRD
jgi:hypothetical protein